MGRSIVAMWGRLCGFTKSTWHPSRPCCACGTCGRCCNQRAQFIENLLPKAGTLKSEPKAEAETQPDKMPAAVCLHQELCMDFLCSRRSGACFAHYSLNDQALSVQSQQRNGLKLRKLHEVQAKHEDPALPDTRFWMATLNPGLAAHHSHPRGLQQSVARWQQCGTRQGGLFKERTLLSYHLLW